MIVVMPFGVKLKPAHLWIDRISKIVHLQIDTTTNISNLSVDMPLDAPFNSSSAPDMLVTMLRVVVCFVTSL